MTENRHFAGWLRSLAGLAAVAGVLALSACGGGSGAPNNFFKSTVTVAAERRPSRYSGRADDAHDHRRRPGPSGPFRPIRRSCRSRRTSPGATVLLLADNVTADTDVTITVQDLGPLSPVAPTATVARHRARVAARQFADDHSQPRDDCGTAVCSGQTALATVTVLGRRRAVRSRARQCASTSSARPTPS